MSSSNIPSAPIDNTALIADIVSQINANTNTKATATQAAIVADGDVTQAKLDTLTTVNGNISTDVQAINEHVTSENDRVLANIPSNSPVKSIQRGNLEYNIPGNGYYDVVLAAVDVAKSSLSINGGIRFNEGDSMPVTEFFSSTVLRIHNNLNAYANHRVYWEVVEYV